MSHRKSPLATPAVPDRAQREDSLAVAARRGKLGRLAPPTDISGGLPPFPARSIHNRLATWAFARVVHSPTRPRQHAAAKTFTLRP
jgi:hypothetical protein